MAESCVEIDTGTREILGRIEDGVQVITLNRPAARNAMSPALTDGLCRMIAAAHTDDRVGVVVLTGAGSAFCAGGDVKKMDAGGIGDGDASFAARVADLRARQNALTGALTALRKPTIAALPGAAAGAGLAFALACDIRFVARSAFITTGYAKVGLSGDFGIAWLLTRTIGSGRARQLMFTAEPVDAEEMARIGLANRVIDDDALMAETLAFAKALAAGPRVALGLIKDNLDDALAIAFPAALDREAERLMRSAGTADHKDAARAFVEKRAPVFQGR